MARDWQHVFLLAFAFLVLWWQPGVYMNDEVGQAVALTALAQGDLVVTHEASEAYEPFGQGRFRHWSLAGEGQVKQFIASVPLMVAALPVLFLFRFLESGLGVMGTVGLAAGIVIGSAVAVELRWRRRIDWGQWGFLAGLAVFAAAWPRSAGFAASPMLEMASQQFVGMAAMAGAGVLMWDLARRIWGRRAAGVAIWVFLLATPAFFWAGNLKYHGLNIVIVAWALHALWRAWNGTWAWAEAGLATGIGFWNHGPTGLTMMAGFGVVGVWALVRGVVRLARARREARSDGAARAAGAAPAAGEVKPLRGGLLAAAPLLGLAGFAIGVLPDLALRWWYRNRLIRPRYFGGSTTGESVTEGIRESAVQQVENTSYLDAPMEYVSTLWELLVWTPYLSLGTAMGVLAMAPWLALALRRWRPHPLVVWGLVVVLTTIIGSGRRLVEIGAGIDQRYVSALWPILVMAAMPGILALWREHLRQAAWWSVAVAAWGTLLLALVALANGGSVLYRGFAYDVTALHRFGGIALFVAAAVAWPLRGHLPDRVRPLIATVPLVSSGSLWLMVGIAGEMRSQSLAAPFVVWPMDVVVGFVRKLYGL